MTDHICAAKVWQVDASDHMEPFVSLQRVGQREPVQDRRRDVREGGALGQNTGQGLQSFDEARRRVEAAHPSERAIQFPGEELSFGETERPAVSDGERDRGKLEGHGLTLPVLEETAGKPQWTCGQP
jgi:hypothetical protein